MERPFSGTPQKPASGEKICFHRRARPWEYEEFNLGAQLVPLGEFMNRVWELEEHKNDEIVLHCRSGARSGMAQGILQGAGFTNVRNLAGGVLGMERCVWREKP